ncbi:MAG TPA: tetratricopeptide repeat protein [Cellvibrio sp.]|nr:tetratricopeptide repeat protein [Cellvibrio sp.]
MKVIRNTKYVILWLSLGFFAHNSFAATITQESLKQDKVASAPEVIAYNRAQTEAKGKNYIKAIASYNESLKLNPNFYFAYIGLAEVENARGDNKMAQSHFDQAFSLGKNSPALLTAYGKYLLKNKQLDEAQVYFEKALKIAPDFADANIELAVIYLTFKKQPDKAIFHYQQALITKPSQVDILFGLSSAQLAAGKLPDALASLSKASALEPNNNLPHHFKGVYLARDKQFSMAIKELEQSLALSPNFYPSSWLLADVYLQLNDIQKTIKIFDQLSRNSDDKPLALFKTGLLYHLQKDYVKAKSYYQSALKLNAKMAEVYNNLANISIDQNTNFGEGLSYAKKAVEIQPENFSFLDTLGWLYYLSGDKVSAEKTLQRALKINPNFSEAISHLQQLKK